MAQGIAHRNAEVNLQPEGEELIVVIGRVIVGAPPLDRVDECRGGSGAVVDQRVIEIEEDVVDPPAPHAARIKA